ncbi:MAG: 6-hydroxynicotinate reductase [Lautropia sp.]
MAEHTKTDGLPGIDGGALPAVLERSRPRNERMASEKIECNACPVLCQISAGRTGACDRYANQDGRLIRVDPVVLLRRTLQQGDGTVVPFAALGPAAATEGPAAAGTAAGAGTAATASAGPAAGTAATAAAAASAGAEPAGTLRAGRDWSGDLLLADEVFVTGIGSSTTYPDYKPAPFIVASQADGVDLVTVVTEGIFSYCSFKIKIDTDRYLGPEQANVRCRGEVVGHVTTAEYGSQMLSLGGVHHLTGGSKKEGRVTVELMAALGNRKPVEVTIDGGAQLVIEAGKAPIVNGVEEQRMRVGCGSATIGIFARQLFGKVDEVVVVDDHITGVLTEHQAGRCLDMAPSGIRMRGRKSTPGRYFQVANPGTGWGGTDLSDPLAIIEGWDAGVARPGLRLLMTSTTGEHASWYVLDEALVPREAEMPAAVRAVVERIGENCEPSLSTVLFLGGAGGSLRAGVTENPIQLTRSIKQALVNVTCGGAPAYVWPGGGITVMADVMRMPADSFGTVPTPAIVAPIEFSMRLADFQALGGHVDHIRSLADVLRSGAWHDDGAPTALRWAGIGANNPWPLGRPPLLG